MTLQLNQSITLARFWGGLVASGILLHYLQGAHEQLMSGATATQNISEAGRQGIQWSTAIWDALPFLITFVGLLGLIATAIFQRRGVVPQ